MATGFLLIGLFSLSVFTAVIIYDRPRKQRQKISGRGGDFDF